MIIISVKPNSRNSSAGDRVLDADHLVVLGEHVLPPEAELVVPVLVNVSVMRATITRGSGHVVIQRRTP